MASSIDSPSQQSSSRVQGQSEDSIPGSVFDTSFSSSPPAFDATAIMILPPHQLGFPRLDAAQPPVRSVDGVPLSSIRCDDTWAIASTSSTPDSVSSFAFSPVSPSWSDGPSSSLPCSPGTSFEDAPPTFTALSSSSHVKGKARAPALLRSPSLSLPSLDTSVEMPRANLTMSPPQLESLVISSSRLVSASCVAPSSSSPEPLSAVTGGGSRRRLTKARPSAQNMTRRNTLAIDRLLDESRAGTSIGVTYETASALKPHATLPSRRDLRKGRSHTVPDLIVWNPQYDYVEDTHEDMSATIVLAPRSTFDSRLPREVKLSVFTSLLRLHEAEHVKRVKSSEWTSVKAGTERYVGREKGYVELVKLSRVSRSWQALAFDGQLWAHLDMHALVQMPEATVTKIVQAAGAFMRSVSLEGYHRLTTSILRQLNASIVLAQPGRKSLPVSQLTGLDLAGCKAVTTKVLHELILVSPGLQHVSFKGVSAVTNVTCVILGRTCPQLLTLNLSRCRNIDAAGVISVASAPIGAAVPYTQLKELRLSGLRSASAALMVTLARGAPRLEVLDLSYSIGLVDSDFEVFTAWRSEWDAFGDESPFQKIPLTAREMGYDPSDPTRYFKRLSKLRHLNISHCTLLTDAACGHLSYSLPLLQSLELAGLGPDLEDDGVVRLLRTTPLIRKIDLEDATEISNAVLETLTLDADELRARRVRPQAFDAYPGERLEHLILSSCGRITSEAATALIRSCKHLRVLEVDGTRASGSLVREFCRHAKRHGHEGTEINVSDCRGLPGDSLVRELNPHTRHRRGWRGWDARRLRFLDSEGDCNESRVLFKSFWTWQASDAARTARDKKIRAAVSAGTATALEGAELTQLLEAEELSFCDPIEERNARFKWVKVLGQLSPSGDSCVIM